METHNIPNKENQGDNYNFIIVGGGSAGAVLATRLTENPDTNVLLLEAGSVFSPNNYPEETTNSNIMGANLDPNYEWGYKSQPGYVGHSINAIRGKILGGSSAINGTAAIRALPRDFRKWATEGIEGWSWDEVFPYYLKMETSNVADTTWHGHSGPFPIIQLSKDDITPFQLAFIHANVENGVKEIADFNASEHHGVGPFSKNVVDGIRMNTGMTYLTESVRNRKNLTIIGNAVADRVLFNGTVAYGLLLADGREFNADEIILSAGAYGSPAILMRSGIGPKQQLDSFGIHVIADLPVGENLIDQPFYYNAYAVNPDTIGRQLPAIGVKLWTKSAYAEEDELDIHIMATHLFPPDQSPTHVGVVFAVALANPKSRGTFKLTSKDPLVAPIIDLNFLNSEEDRNRILDGVRLARQIAKSVHFSNIIVQELNPWEAKTDEDILESIKNTVDTYEHPFATAPMGPKDSKMAVVDFHGKVYGVSSLRVVDSSIFPDVVSAAPNPTVIMLAEKLADEIKAG